MLSLLSRLFRGTDGHLSAEKITRLVVMLIAMAGGSSAVSDAGFDLDKIKGEEGALILLVGAAITFAETFLGLLGRMRRDKVEKKQEAIIAATPGAQEIATAMQVGKAGPIPADARHWVGSADRAAMPPPPGVPPAGRG